MHYKDLVTWLLLQEGLHVLSQEEQLKWLKIKEEACSSGVSRNASTGEPLPRKRNVNFDQMSCQ
jgi:hypothetical protein